MHEIRVNKRVETEVKERQETKGRRWRTAGGEKERKEKMTGTTNIKKRTTEEKEEREAEEEEKCNNNNNNKKMMTWRKRLRSLVLHLPVVHHYQRDPSSPSQETTHKDLTPPPPLPPHKNLTLPPPPLPLLRPSTYRQKPTFIHSFIHLHCHPFTSLSLHSLPTKTYHHHHHHHPLIRKSVRHPFTSTIIHHH